MRLTRTIAYALHAALELARVWPGMPVPCSQLARSGQLPERFLIRVLRHLVRRGVLCSTRGVEGGFSLARAPDQITLLDIVAAFDSPLNVTLPILSGMSPEVRSAILGCQESASQAARNELSKVTLAELLRAHPVEHPPTHAPPPPHSSGNLPLSSSDDFDNHSDGAQATR